MSSPVSGSSYIIICNGRIDLSQAKTPEAQIAAASRCAADTCAYIGTRYRASFNHADLAPVTAIQHSLMDSLISGEKLDKDETEQKCAALIDELTVLEHKYDSGGSGY